MVARPHPTSAAQDALRTLARLLCLSSVGLGVGAWGQNDPQSPASAPLETLEVPAGEPAAAAAPVMDRSEPAPRSDAAPALGPAAFDLDVRAPQPLRALLLRHLDAQRYRSLPDLSLTEIQRLAQTVPDDARQLLATQGYFDPTVRLEWARAEPKAARPRIVVHVEPGSPTLVRSVELQLSGAMADDPDSAMQREALHNRWSLGAGQRFSQSGWDEAKQQALRQLITERYPLARIAESRADIDPQTHSAALSLRLDSGPRVQWGTLHIEGLQRFDADLVRRLVRLPRGGDYSQEELVAAQQRLVASGYFDSALLTLVQRPTDASQVELPVRVVLREVPLQKIVLGLGVSTDAGPRLSTEYTHHRVAGLGWRAQAQVQLDARNRVLTTQWTAPPDDDAWHWHTAASLDKQIQNDQDSTSWQWRVGRSQLSQRIERQIYLQYDRAQSVLHDGQSATLAQALSVNYAFTVRYFEDMPFPTRGWAWGAELGGGTTLGGQRQAYTRVVSRLQAFVPLAAADASAAQRWRAGRLALRAQVGAVLAHADASLPGSQLFLTGGDTSVRGYALRSLGVTGPDGSVQRGRYLSTASIEWLRPIFKDGQRTDWEGSVFMDVGAVANTPSALHARVGVGSGVRWASPVGPLQVDLAYGVHTRRLRLHLNLGFSF
ncbi:MAG: autotransporter assembly complex family protein [Rhodoferax sp.]